ATDMRQRTLQLSVFLLTLAVASCTDGGPGPINIQPSTGALRGLAYIDRNGNGVLDTNVDGPIHGILVTVVPFGASSPQTRTTTNNLGTFTILNLDVGDYAISVDNASVPDSLRVIKIDSTRVRIIRADTPTVLVNL